MYKRSGILFILLSSIIVILFMLNLFTGDSNLPVSKVWSILSGGEDDGITRDIIISIRLVRTIVAMLVGIALSISGLQMQTVFQNPLADPYLLGVSSGAGLGAALFILGIPLLGLTGTPLLQAMGIVGAGWIGAALILISVTAISRRVKNILGVLVIGVMIGYVAGAIIQILQYLSSAEQLKLFSLWSMGSLGHVTTTKLLIMLPILCTGIVLSVISIKSLNLLLLGEGYAQTMGMNVRKSRSLIFISTMLLAGTVTAFCGPIGFIGLAVPHIARMLFHNADHRVLMPGSVLVGIVAMLLCDLIAKGLILPINSIAALLGVPIILWVVIKNLRVI